MRRAKCQKCGHYDYHLFETCPKCGHIDKSCDVCRGSGSIVVTNSIDSGNCSPQYSTDTWPCKMCNGTGEKK